MKKQQSYYLAQLKQKALVASISVISLLMGNGTSVQHAFASDMEIYQNPAATNYPILMLALDNSSSMTTSDATYDSVAMSRLDALKKSLIAALQATDSSGNYVIPNTTSIGISKFAGAISSNSTESSLSNFSNLRRAYIWLPAKRLDSTITVSSTTYTWRQYLINQINTLSADSSTPTSTLLAETYAYLWGSRSDTSNTVTGLSNAYMSVLTGFYGSTLSNMTNNSLISNNKYIAPISSLSSTDQQCSTQGVFFLTDGAPSGIPAPHTQSLLQNVVANAGITDSSSNSVGSSAIACTNTTVPAVYYNYNNARSSATTNGEFREMGTLAWLTAKGKTPNTTWTSVSGFQDRSGWSCIADMVKVGATTASSTSGKRIYLATVGFGPLFSTATYNGSSVETCDTDSSGNNIHCYINGNNNSTNSSNNTTSTTYGTGGTSAYSNTLNADALKNLGNIVGTGSTYGTTNPIGGYTYGSSGENVQAAFTKFVSALSASSFNAASFGTYSVPKDPFNTDSSYSYISNSSTIYPVFAPQFQPNISAGNSTKQLWLGNLKKYQIISGLIKDKNSTTLLDSNSQVISSTTDFWNSGSSTDGSSALLGGALSQLVTPNASSQTEASKITTRPLWTDAQISSNQLVGTNSLVALNTNKVLGLTYTNTSDTNYKSSDSSTYWRANEYQPYLLSALGYKLSASTLAGYAAQKTWTNFSDVSGLSTMQQMGAVVHSDPVLVTLSGTYDSTSGNYTNRSDYVVFGSMQGILHMVNQSTGKEVFSFLPNEILQDSTTTDGSTTTTTGGRRDALLYQDNTVRTTTLPYSGIDAPWNVWTEYSAGSGNQFTATTANIYGGMRMGGRSYYGINVLNPSSPSFLFQIDPANGTIKSSSSVTVTSAQKAALQAMGQSWSKPTLAKIRYNNQIRKVIIVGGGYDTAYEASGYTPQTALGTTTSTTTTSGPVVSTSDSTTTTTNTSADTDTTTVASTANAYNSQTGAGTTTTRGTTSSSTTSTPVTTTTTSGNTTTTSTVTTISTVETTPITITTISYSRTCSIWDILGVCIGRWSYYKTTDTSTYNEVKTTTYTTTSTTTTTTTYTTTASSNKGAGVYIFDATTGELIWDARFGSSGTAAGEIKNPYMQYSVVSQIKAVDRNNDGLVDHLYFGDLGGQVWRVDLNNTYSTSTSNFASLTRLANFSSQHQRFYEMPTFTIHTDTNGRFAAVALASGNRSHPLDETNTTNNRVYVLLDHDVTSSSLYNSTYTKTLADATESDLVAFSSLGTSATSSFIAKTKLGWYYEINNTGTTSGTATTYTKGTVKALGPYVALASSGNYSDLYVSLYNPEDSSSNQPTTCTGGITGVTTSAQFCLPYGVCSGLSSSSVSFTKMGDGIQKLNPATYASGSSTVVGILNVSTATDKSGTTNSSYIKVKQFKPLRWFNGN